MTSETEQVEVTQADREAAALALGYVDYADATDYRLSGSHDRQVANMVQAFARHRLSTHTDEVKLREALQGLLGSGKAGTWAEAVEPLVARFDVAAKFNADAVHNAEGSAALAELIRTMAEKLDTAVARATAALQPEGEG